MWIITNKYIMYEQYYFYIEDLYLDNKYKYNNNKRMLPFR